MIRSGTLPTLPTIAAFVVGSVALCALTLAAMRATATGTARPIEPDTLGERVLIIAAHPDDEVLATGGTIHRLVGSGTRVKVVIITAGDSYRRAADRQTGVSGSAAYLALGEERHQESHTAVEALGLDPADVVSLGYADGTSIAMWDRCWDATATAPGRTEATSVPYAWAAVPGAPLNGIGLASQLEKQIRDFAPDTIITPDAHETHPDHALLAAFSMYAMNASGFEGRHLSDIVHFRHYPYPWAHLPALALNPPPQLVQDGTEWLALPLRPEDQAAKSAGIAAYRSQTAIADMGLYMRAFIRTNELYSLRAPARIEAASTDQRPVPGTSGTISKTPRPVIAAPPGSKAPRIDSIRMLRGPGMLWVGLVCDRAPRADDSYRLGIRLFGSGAPARLDIALRAGKATVLSEHADSLSVEGIAAETDGATVWIGIPSGSLTGRTRLLVGAMAAPPGGSLMRTAWRQVDL